MERDEALSLQKVAGTVRHLRITTRRARKSSLVDRSSLFACLLRRASGNYTAVSSKEKFTASLKDVFAVKKAQPPPPPSSRRARPISSSPPPPPPSLRAPRASAPSNGAAPDEPSLTKAPDSLVPVRFTDLLHEESAKAVVVKHASPRAKFPVLGAFIAGAIVVLALQMRTRHGRTTPPPLAQPPALAPEKARDVRVEAPKPSPAPVIAPAASIAAVAPPAPAPSGTVESVPAAAPEPPASAKVATAIEDANSAQPVRPRRKRARSSSSDYEIPTAEFPDNPK
jgi:hypothetical protein